MIIAVAKKLALAVLIAATAITAVADQEHRVKAEFAYKFAAHIEWPADRLGGSDSRFQVGVVGPDTYGRDLDETFQGTSIYGHPVSVRRLQSESEIPDCRIVIVGFSDAEHIAHLAKLCRKTGTVLIGDSPDFAKFGGTIGLLIESNHVRFEINLSSAQATEVSISSKLLNLARNVFR